MNVKLTATRWLGPCLFLSLIFSSLDARAADEFPGREVYPNVAVISTQQLHDQYENSIIIDARSPFEYETLRIKGAINIPLKLNNEKFIAKILELRANSSEPIVFYCNGHTCMKSYKAARKAMLYAKAKNVYAYDAGVFEWAKHFPDQAELLGKSPVTADKLISRENFTKHLLPAVDFIKTANKDTIILDIRDRIQRDGFYIFSGDETSIALNEREKLTALIRKAKKQNRPLYIYDAVGKQVRWLQYYLEAEQVSKYYFMEGGANAFFKIPIHELMDS